MANRKNRHPAFCLCGKIESGCNGYEATTRLSKQQHRKLAEAAVSGAKINALLLNPRNMSRGKLPATIALDQCVRELHYSIEWFAIRYSLHARFSEDNCHVVAVHPR